VRYPTALVPATLRRRYQRFLADVELPSGEVVCAHVPNSGRMTSCSAPGSPCLAAPADGVRRRLAWTLEQVIVAGVPVGVNTSRANALAEEALRDGLLRLGAVRSPFQVRREVARGRSRFDLCLDDAAGVVWVEVKNVTLVRDGIALFPDAVTARGARHLRELAALVRGGGRAALVYVVQRLDARCVTAEAIVDPGYAAAAAEAAAAGVELRAVAVEPSPVGLRPIGELPVVAGAAAAAQEDAPPATTSGATREG
jgi:sugar fermentation stimulation protein A